MFYLSLSDLLASLSWYPFGRVATYLCDVQAVGLHFFLCASFFWTMCISISLFFIFYSDKTDLDHYLKFFHIICWGIPLAVVIACLSTGKYGYNGAWCFIHDPKGIFPLFYYVPLIIVFLINLVILVLVRVKISKHSQSAVAKMNVLVSFYLLAFVTSQFFAVLNTIQGALAPQSPIFILYILHATFQPLQGFLNCIVYGTNEGFVSHYVEWFERKFYRVRRRRDREQETDSNGLLMDYDYKSDEED